MRTCNKCFFTGHTDYFVPNKRYAGGVKPLCKMCQQKYQRTKRGLPPKEWEPRFIKKKDSLSITPEGLDILIRNGFARNREEALRYIQ